ncbi:MAG: DUF2059 domain-containing protein [Cellvibrionaceae bacterium]|nr:DUF2059 domain-containing protein [Cellvibrionaceae bacterium]
MLKKHYQKLSFFILFFSSMLSHAGLSDESLTKIIDLSGLTVQINQFPGLIKAGMEQAKQQGSPIPATEYQSMLSSIDQTILPADIIGEIKNTLKQSITEEDATKLLAWYKSDLGKHITKAEEQASSPAAYQQMMQLIPQLLENTERLALAKRMDALIGGTDMAMTIQEHTSIAVFTAIMTAMQPQAPANIEAFKAQMDAASTETRAAVEQMVIASYIYAYQNIETDQLNQYQAFLTEASTITFNKAVVAGMSRGLELSISKWAQALASIFAANHQ